MTNQSDKPITNERLKMNGKPSHIKTGLVGLAMGIIGSIIGFFPIMALHYQLTDFIFYKIFGSYRTTPDILIYLVAGILLPFAGIIILPIGGAIFGIIGALIGLRRHLARIWLWAGIAGLLFNFLVSFGHNSLSTAVESSVYKTR